MDFENDLTIAYKKATHLEAWFLEQRWDGRRFWYSSGNYVAWLESKILKQRKKGISIIKKAKREKKK